MAKKVLDIEATSLHLLALMRERQITHVMIQEELELGCAQTVYAWTNPKKPTIPSIDNLVLLAQLLEVELGSLLILKDCY